MITHNNLPVYHENGEPVTELWTGEWPEPVWVKPFGKGIRRTYESDLRKAMGRPVFQAYVLPDLHKWPNKSQWECEYRKLNQCPQRQDSLEYQLQDLGRVANKLGMYDAADFISRIITPPVTKS